MRDSTTMASLIEQMRDASAMAVAGGLVLATGGNLSARLPGSDVFAVTGSGTRLDRLTADDFTLMDLDGIPLGGPPPSSEWKLHQRTYVARPDVNAVVHLHPQYTVLLEALGYPIRLITLDHAQYVKSIGVAPYAPNGSDELGDTAAEQFLEHNCVVLSHHGCSTVGPDVFMAYRRAINLEEAAIATYRALTLGDSSTTFPVTSSPALHA